MCNYGNRRALLQIVPLAMLSWSWEPDPRVRKVRRAVPVRWRRGFDLSNGVRVCFTSALITVLVTCLETELTFIDYRPRLPSLSKHIQRHNDVHKRIQESVVPALRSHRLYCPPLCAYSRATPELVLHHGFSNFLTECHLFSCSTSSCLASWWLTTVRKIKISHFEPPPRSLPAQF